MTLDAPLSDAEYRAMLAQRTAHLSDSTEESGEFARTVNRTVKRVPALGPDSPLHRKATRRGTVGGASKPREHDIQVAVFRWIAANLHTHPQFALVYAIPNGGHRHISAAVKLKSEGVRAGVPDFCYPCPRGGFGACYVELKIPGGVTSPAQADWQYQLARAGNCVHLATTSEAAIACLLEYDGLT